MTSFPNLLIVRRDFPANTVAEFIAYAKANPGKINGYASQGPGTTPHLSGEWLARAIGTELVQRAVSRHRAGDERPDRQPLRHVVPTRAVGRLRAGEQQAASTVLGVASKERIAALPDVPTLEEAGLKDFVSYAWNALAAPPRTPKPVTAKFNAAVNEIFKMPDMVEQFARLKMHTVGGTPEQMAEFLAAERKRWGAVIEAAHVTVNQ